MTAADIVIVHGWNLSGSRFESLASRFRLSGYRVFTPDMPGFGKEPAPDKPWHVVDYAEFLRGYIKKQRIKNPVFVGHSFGGRVAIKYAQLYPKDVRALVLSGTPGFSPVPKKKLFVFLLIAKIGGLLFAVPPLNLFADWARRWLYYIAGAREFLRAEGSMRQTFKHVVSDDLSEAMASIHIPCFLLWGEYDIIVPVSIARKMQEVLSQATLSIIPEQDHGVPFKKPDIFAGYVIEFLRKL